MRAVSGRLAEFVDWRCSARDRRIKNANHVGARDGREQTGGSRVGGVFASCSRDFDGLTTSTTSTSIRRQQPGLINCDSQSRKSSPNAGSTECFVRMLIPNIQLLKTIMEYFHAV